MNDVRADDNLLDLVTCVCGHEVNRHGGAEAIEDPEPCEVTGCGCQDFLARAMAGDGSGGTNG